jgi:hypothetical protein
MSLISAGSISLDSAFKGSRTGDFQVQVFFKNQSPPGPGSVSKLLRFAELLVSDVIDTDEQLIIPVSMTTVINIHSRIFEKIRNGPKGILRGPGDTDS